MAAPRRARQVAVRQALVLEKAVRKTRAVTKKKDKNNEEKVAQGLRSRAREAPSLLLQAGLASLMTHLLSKSKEEEVREALQLLSDKSSEQEEGSASLGDLEPGEGKGYSTMLALIIDALRELDPTSRFKGLAEKYSTRSTLLAVKDLLDNPKEEARLSRVLVPYLVELKKLVEAIVGEPK